MSNQAFIVVPMPTQGESHDFNSTSQQISPETKQQIANSELNAINGDKIGSQHGSSLTQFDQSSNLKDSVSGEVEPGQDLHLKNKESKEKQNVQESAIVKKIIDDPRGLFSLINWENPRLTLSSLTAVVTLLLASRYFHLMQWVFKALSVILGVVTAVEFVTRSTSGKSITLRVKPQTYFTVSESTLNRVFAEAREATQYIVVQAQKLIYGEDLSNTFIAFTVSFSLYWLIKLFTLWQLAVLVLPFVYTVPLILSAQSKQKIHDVANTTAKKASDKATEVKHKAQDLDLQQTGKDAADKASSTVSNLKSKANDTAENATKKVLFTADDSLNSPSVPNESAEKTPRSTYSTIDGGEPFGSSNEPQYVPSDASDTTQSTGTSDSHVTFSNEQNDPLNQHTVPYGAQSYGLASPESGNVSTTKSTPGITNRNYPSIGKTQFGPDTKISDYGVRELGST